MKSIARWSVEHRVTVNLVMVFIVIVGVMSLTRMKREVFPYFTLDLVSVQVLYPGASPEEIEEGIVLKIEEKVKSVQGIKRIISSAQEGLGRVLLELKEDVDDVQKVVDDVKTLVDTIDTFPEDAETPLIQEITIKDEAINIAVYGDEISENNLRRYGLTFDQVTAALKSGSLDLPGGGIKTAGGDVLIRAKGQRYTGREFEEIPLITLADGTMVRLGDVAQWFV